MVRIQKLISSIFILASLTAPYALKALSFSPCDAQNCATITGLTNCLVTNDDYEKWEAGPFFKKNSDGTYMQRITQVVVALSTKTAPGADDTFQVPITIPVIVNVISPAAFKAFQKVARQNPRCMETFCQNNCLLLQDMNPIAIENQVKYFDSQSKIIIGGVVYRAPAVPANNLTGAEKVPSIDDWENKNPEEKVILAQNYLIDQSNNITSLRCLSETDGGVKLRMFCSQCALGLDKGRQALLSKTCTSFDASRNLGYGMELEELSEDYQQELARAKLEQARIIQQKALSDKNPKLRNANGAETKFINFSNIASQFSTGLPEFSNNPYRIKGGIEDFNQNN